MATLYAFDFGIALDDKTLTPFASVATGVVYAYPYTAGNVPLPLYDMNGTQLANLATSPQGYVARFQTTAPIVLLSFGTTMIPAISTTVASLATQVPQLRSDLDTRIPASSPLVSLMAALPTVPSTIYCDGAGRFQWLPTATLGTGTGTGTGTGAGTGTGGTTATGVPGVPTNVKIALSDPTFHLYTMTWVAPATGGTPTSYLVTEQVDSFSPFTTIVTGNTFTSGSSIQNGQVYRLSVQAVNAQGSSQGVGSAWLAGQTIPTPTTGGQNVAVTGGTAPTKIQVQNMTVTPSPTSILVTWQAPALTPQNVTGYGIGRDGTDASGTGNWSTLLPATTLSYTFDNLVSGQTYTITITPAVSSGTPGSFSLTTTLPGGTTTGGGTGGTTGALPGVPVNVAIAPLLDGYNISWLAPATGGAPTKYYVTAAAGSFSTGQLTGGPAILSYWFTNAAIVAGATIRLAVAAVNDYGQSGTIGSAWISGQAIPTPTLNGANATITSSGATTIRVSSLSAVTQSGQVTIAWGAPTLTPQNVTGYTVERGGVDASGTGAWSTTVTATTTTFTFTNLVDGTSYPFTVTPIVSTGTVASASITVPAGGTGTTTTPPATGGGTTTPPVTGSTGTGTVATGFGTPTGGSVGVSKLAALKLPARGWFSGASGEGIDSANTAFGTWRGNATDALSNWLDTEDGGAWGGGIAAGAGPAMNHRGILDIAIGGPSNYSSAAGGSLDASLRTFLTNVRRNRTINGIVYPTILRPFHEMNGDWYAWSVSPGEEAAFKSVAKRWRGIMDSVFPEAIWAFCPNGESTTGVAVANLWDTGVWDLVGADRYNQYPYIGTNNAGGYTSWPDGSTRGDDSNPVGAQTWLAFARNRGVPLYFPEYANNGYDSGTPANGGDDPYWCQQFFAWVRANAGKGSGQILAEMWFNQINKEENRWHLYSPSVATRQPKVAAAYQTFFRALPA